MKVQAYMNLGVGLSQKLKIFFLLLVIGCGALAIANYKGLLGRTTHVQKPEETRGGTAKSVQATSTSSTLMQGSPSGDELEKQNEQKWIDSHLVGSTASVDWVSKNLTDGSSAHFHNDDSFKITVIKPGLWEFSTHIDNDSSETDSYGNEKAYEASPTRTIVCDADMRNLDWHTAKVQLISGGGGEANPDQADHDLYMLGQHSVIHDNYNDWDLEIDNYNTKCQSTSPGTDGSTHTLIDLFFQNKGQAEDAKQALIKYSKEHISQLPTLP